MDKLEIRRRALYAAAHITFVAAATGCQARQLARAERDDRGPQMAPTAAAWNQGAPVQTVAAAAQSPREACPTQQQQQTAPTPTIGPLPTAQTGPTPAPTPVVPASESCTEAASNVPPGEAFPPAVQLCCAAVIRAAEFARANHTPMAGDHWPCCHDNWGSSVCQAWGPPAPAKARRLTATDRARVLSRWS